MQGPTGDPFDPNNFGDVDVTVLSSTNAPQAVLDGLTAFKNLGIQDLNGPHVDIVVDLTDDALVMSECPEPTSGHCAALSGRLMSLPQTVAYLQGINFIQVYWNKLMSKLFSATGIQLRFVVIFSNGQMQIYKFDTLGLGTAFSPIANTIIDENGSPVNGGSIQGWANFFDIFGGDSINLPLINGLGGGSGCTITAEAVRDSGGNLVQVNMVASCES